MQATAAGARRTDSAYPGLVTRSRAPDVPVFSFPGQSPTFGQVSLAAAARLPQVTVAAMLAGYTVVNPASANLLAPETDAVPGRFWHRKILAGRQADLARPGEVNISFTLAEALYLGVGDILRATLLTATRHLARFSFRVVGIDAAPSEFPLQTGTGTDVVWATPAFYCEHHAGLQIGFGAAFRLRRGSTDLPAFQQALSRLGHRRALLGLGFSRAAAIGVAAGAAVRCSPSSYRRCCPSAWLEWPSRTPAFMLTAACSAWGWPARYSRRWPRPPGRPGGRRGEARRGPGPRPRGGRAPGQPAAGWPVPPAAARGSRRPPRRASARWPP